MNIRLPISTKKRKTTMRRKLAFIAYGAVTLAFCTAEYTNAANKRAAKEAEQPEQLIMLDKSQITVKDGDTIDYIDKSGKKHTMRLWGYDAHELDQKCHTTDTTPMKTGEDQKNALQAAINLHNNFRCYLIAKKDRWGREYGACYVGGRPAPLISFAKTMLTCPTDYSESSWIRPTRSVYLQYLVDVVRDVYEGYKGANMPRFIARLATASLEEMAEHLENWAFWYDYGTVTALEREGCTVRTPAHWRKIKRDMSKK